MEEKKLVERPLMSEEEFKNHTHIDYVGDLEKGIIHLKTFEAVGKFKSVRRAIRRGHVSLDGFIYPKRPFGNTNTKYNRIRRAIYEQFKHRKHSV